MRKFFTLFSLHTLILFGSQTAIAQAYLPLVDTGKYWYDDVVSTQFPPTIYTTCYTIHDVDSCFGGECYKTLCYSNYSDVWSCTMFIREDTLAKKIYLNVPGWTQEQLLYDFSLAVGDSFNYFPIISLTYESFAGKTRKKFTFSNNEVWYEGVGSLLGLRKENLLSCYVENDSIPFYWGAWAGSSCWHGMYEGQSGMENLSIYPNPSSGKVWIETPRPSEGSGFISVYDMKGNQIKQRALANREKYIVIDFSDLEPGLYFIKAGQYHGKFVKQN